MNVLKKIARVISNIVFYVLIAIIILLIVYVIIVNVYKKQDRLGDIPINFYTILTTSMVPKIQAGDIVITYKDKNDLYDEGDVITFVSEGNMTKGITITHRIIKKEILNGNYFYYTKGDANNTADTSPVSSSNVIGKVVLKIPKAGYIQQFMVSKFGWLVVVVLPCLSIIIYDIVKMFERAFKIKKEKDLLSNENTKEKRKDLDKALNFEYVSKDLQDKIDTVYDAVGIDNNKEEILDDEKPKVKEEDQDVEIL